MRIESNCTNFTSRNKTIRFADDIARKTNRVYPRMSSTWLGQYACKHNKHFAAVDRVNEKLEDYMRIDKDDMFEEAHSVIGYVKALVKSVKKYKVGNCGESAQLAAIIAKANGIKNCSTAYLHSGTGNDLDHTVVLIKDGKKPYIIDAWLGFADYVPQAIEKYKTIYNNLFKPDNPEVIEEGFYNFKFEPSNSEYEQFLTEEFSRNQRNHILKMFPEQFMKKYLY